MDCRCNSLQISVVDVKGLTNLLFIIICPEALLLLSWCYTELGQGRAAVLLL